METRPGGRRRIPKLGGSVAGKSVLILCGPGNNGGDGAALARILAPQGAVIDVILLGELKAAKGDARTNLGVLCQGNFDEADIALSGFGELRQVRSKVEWENFWFDEAQAPDVVIDAIFGTGLARPLEDWVSDIIDDLNSSESGVVMLFTIDRRSDRTRLRTGESWARFSRPTLPSPLPHRSRQCPAVPASFNGELRVEENRLAVQLVAAQPSSFL